ncbi:MAG: sugar transferase [Chloroflexi bacterium]|nr:sugar transferase [Chloroflexota bacterium]
MLRQFSIQRVIFFFGLDWLGTLGMMLLAGLVRGELGILPQPITDALQLLRIPLWLGEVRNVQESILPQVLVIVAVIWPCFFVVFSVYDGRRNDSLKAELINVFLAVCVSTVTLAGVLYLTYRETSRVLFVLFFFMDVVLLLGVRVVLWTYRLNWRVGHESQRRPVIVVGAGPVGRNVVEELRKYSWAHIDLIGYLDDDPEKQGAQVAGLLVLGRLDQVSAIIDAYRVQDAVVALPLHAHDRIVEICQALQQRSVHVHVIPDLFALSFPSATLDGFGGIPVIDLGQPGIRGWRRFLKRAFDTLAVSIGLILLSPLLLLIAILVKFDSPGPILYKQTRIGEDGRSFTMLKFRSMRADADTTLHKRHVTRLIEQNLSPDQLGVQKKASLKLENDPRVTKVGKIIRKMSLDELPQLFNVLRGEMSLVGPRPPLVYEVELYKDWHRRRFEAIPGITGLWQVKGRNRVSFDEMVRMDLEYIERQSLWLDVQILLRTPLAVLAGRGAG